MDFLAASANGAAWQLVLEESATVRQLKKWEALASSPSQFSGSVPAQDV